MNIKRWITKGLESVLYRLRPDLEVRQHLFSAYADESSVGRYDQRAAAEAYQRRAWVHKAVSVVAQSISPLPVQVVDREGTPIDGHPVAELLERVNDAFTAADLWEMWAVNMLLVGEIGLELVRTKGGELGELWPRKGDEIRIQQAKERAARRYQPIGGYTIDDGLGDPYDLGLDELAWYRFYNPLKPNRGLAPITAIRAGLTIDELAQAWSALFFKNSARPDFAIIAPQGLTRSERDEILSKFLRDQQGVERSHLPVVLEDGITDIKTFGFSPADTEWIEQRKLSREEVGAIFGVPDEIMGWGRDTYENFGQAKRVFWQLTLVPLLTKRDNDTTAFFQRAGDLEPGYRVATDLTGVGELQEDLSEKIAQLELLWSMGAPYNQAVEDLGLPLSPIEGGDVGFLPMGIVPVADKLAEDEPEPEPEEDMPDDDAPEEGPDAEDPDEESEPEDDGEWQEEQDGEQNAFRSILRSPSFPEFGSDTHKAAWLLFKAKAEEAEAEMRRMLRRAFQAQEDRVQAVVREAGSVAEVELDAIFDLEAEIRIWYDTFRAFVARIVEEHGAEAIALLGQDLPFDASNPEIVNWLDTQVWQFAEQINTTTQNELGALLATAKEEEISIPELSDRISQLYKGFKGPRAEMIAQTEIEGAGNFGTMAGYSQAGLRYHGWLTALDERVRTAHLKAHGQVVEVGTPFRVGGERLMFPGDPAGSPENIINCRCTLYPAMPLA